MKKSLFYEQSWDGSSDKFYFSTKKNNQTPPHFHKDIEIIYNINGTKKISINGMFYTLKSNMLAISFMYDIHQYYSTDTDSTQITFTIPYKYSTDLYAFLKNNKPVSNIMYDFDNIILSFIEKLKEEKQKNTPNPIIIKGLFICIQGFILNNLILSKDNETSNKNANLTISKDNETSSKNANLLKEILNYIDNNYKSDITLDILASHFGYNKFYFSKIFHSFFHTNISEYLGIIRLSYTLDYISEHNSSVIEAASECGFKSIKTFYKYYNKFKYNKMSNLQKPN